MKGRVIKEKYIIIKVLGRDSLTKTYLARGKGWYFHKRYVIKKFRPILGNPQAREIKHLFYQEANILQLLSGKNPQIPRLYDYFMDGEDFYLIREWIEGVTLEQKVKREGKLPEERVAKILGSILSVLEYIHDFDLVYRELSPSSIVLRQQNWSDRVEQQNYLPVPIYFSGIKGLERETQKSDRRSLVLANQKDYISPEQKRGETAYGSDFYSLGLTAIYLLTAKTPAELMFEPYTKRLLWHHEVPSPNINLVRVIDRAISPHQSDRFTSAKEMLNALYPQSITISALVDRPEEKFKLTPELKIVSTLLLVGLGAMSLVLALLNFDFAVFERGSVVTKSSNNSDTSTVYSNNSTAIPSPSALPQSNTQSPSPKALNSPLDIPVFRVGTSQLQITDALGKPAQESRGYWGNSRAYLYRDFAQQQVDLGYLFDVTTQTALQTEISFPQSVEETDVKLVLQQLLMSDYSTQIEQQIERVVREKSDKQKFSVNNLQGIVQRNSQNRIYVGVWQQGFHD